MRIFNFLFVITMVFSLSPLLSQSSFPSATECYYIKNANVITRPGIELNTTSIIIRNGLIDQIGSNLQVPYDAKVIEADSMYIYAGFIAPLTHTGLKEEDKKGKEENKPKSPGQATFLQAGITPHLQAIDFFDHKSKSIEGMRKIGFGIAHVVPKGYILPGQGAIISLTNSKSKDEMLLNSGSSMAMSLKTKRGVFPSTLIGAMSRLREIHQNTGLYLKNRSMYASNPIGMKRPASSVTYEAMSNVYNKKQSVFFHASKPKQIHRAITLQKEFGYKMVLSNVKLISPIMKSVATSNPILLSLDLPKEIKEEKEDDKKKENELTPEQRRLTDRKKESYDLYMTQAKILSEMGVTFSFSYTDTKPNDILKSVRRLVKSGLKEEAALSALTTTPATILNISSIAGTIEKGKMGNLVVFDKPMFDEKASIRYIFVEGQMTSIEKKKKEDKKKSSGEMGDINGAWRYTVDVPEDEQLGNLFFEKDGDNYKVRLESDDDPGNFEDGENVQVDGNTMTFEMVIDNDGFIMNVSFDVKFDGDIMEGTVNVEDVGSFPIEAVKRAIPD